MGVTAFSIELIEKVINSNKIKTVIELGSQNLFDKDYGDSYPFASEYYESKEIKYKCIDLGGQNKALKLDLSKPIKHKGTYDLVTDFGTSEHIETGSKHNVTAFYNCLKTKHDLTKVNGFIISENPETGSWKGHGYNYYTRQLHEQLAEANGYEVIEIGRHPAMGNTTDGWNVYCIVKKVNSKPFMKLTDFKKLALHSG